MFFALIGRHQKPGRKTRIYRPFFFFLPTYPHNILGFCQLLPAFIKLQLNKRPRKSDILPFCLYDTDPSATTWSDWLMSLFKETFTYFKGSNMWRSHNHVNIILDLQGEILCCKWGNLWEASACKQSQLMVYFKTFLGFCFCSHLHLQAFFCMIPHPFCDALKLQNSFFSFKSATAVIYKDLFICYLCLVWLISSSSVWNILDDLNQHLRCLLNLHF